MSAPLFSGVDGLYSLGVVGATSAPSASQRFSAARRARRTLAFLLWWGKNLCSQNAVQFLSMAKVFTANNDGQHKSPSIFTLPGGIQKSEINCKSPM